MTSGDTMIKRETRSGKIIITNTVIMLLFLCLLVASNIFFMNRMNNVLMEIDQRQSQKLYLVLQMEEIVRERSLSMLTMYLSNDPWFVDDEYIHFYKMAADFIALRERIYNIGLTEQEADSLNKALALIRKTEPLQNNIVEQVHSGTSANLRTDIIDIDMPLETRLHKAFNTLTEQFRRSGQLARSSARRENITTLYTTIIVSGIVLIAIILLTRKFLFSLRHIEKELIDKTESLGWEATHDHLTRTLNRRGLIQRFGDIRETTNDENVVHSLIYIDLDDFKPVNDRYGHNIGDRLLCGLTEEFHTCIRKHDAIARIGGDEFALILEDCDSKTAMRVSQCLLAKTREYRLPDTDEPIGITGCSIGIYSFRSVEGDFDTIVRRADSACYESKRGGKNRITSHS